MTKTTNQSWELHPFNLFRLYKSTEENGNSHDDHLKASFLLQVSESGKAEDNFRFNIEGDVSIEVEFGGEDLLANKLFKPFSFNMVVRPDDLDIKRNGLSGTWDDLQQAISEGLVLVQKKNSSSGAKKEFLDLWDEEKVKNPNFGAAIRWAILACEGGLRLDLQGLPGMASSLRKDPRLFCDACPAVTLSTLELAVNMELNPPLNGPVPILFSRNETKTSSNLKRNPEAIFSGEKIGV